MHAPVCVKFWHDVMMNVLLHKKVSAKNLALSNRSTFILIVQRSTSTYAIMYLLRIVSFQCIAERRNEGWLLSKEAQSR